ncbi:hypothetical protein Despr_3010 [Desulfobulbus propionicus DSM 2032]|uniref:HEAT repeat domain-containing protein n=1 Tax=Desulfobulbus propionicus (strain ATCC 33891 / DSM 2032 / VKM B-1956 / 1pr3) TaxID=577650 RepID=A0A7U3YPF6_DESPD|nr:DVU0298 family protein [Desulfobulbus propionicus]ADW19143.1 hypothetical protein Despr_3010 [Desulfobulbus propionicus DSM 2032]
MGSRAIKARVLELLRGQDLGPMRHELALLPPKDAVNALFPLICREEPSLRWRAITCMGEAVARLAEIEMEEARIVMRRFLWSLNDESGGIGWGVPEALAESMCHHPVLAKEYAHMLISYMREDGEEICQDGNYIEHPLLQRGVLWGMARLSGCRPELLREKGAGADIPPYLHTKDAETRASAIVACGNLYLTATEATLRQLALDSAPVTLYGEGKFQTTTVGELAQAALERMNE